MKRNFLLCLILILCSAILYCNRYDPQTDAGYSDAAAAKPAGVQTQTDEAEAKVSIRNSQELWLQKSGDSQPSFILKASEHEGFADPLLSPDEKWITLKATDPFDVPDARAEQYAVLINVESKQRIDQYDASEKFKLEKSVIGFGEWITGNPATLKVLLNDGSEQLIDLEKFK